MRTKRSYTSTKTTITPASHTPKSHRYKVRSAINLHVFFGYFSGDPHGQNPNKSWTKLVNGCTSLSRIRTGGNNFVFLSFILSSFYSITICNSFPLRVFLCHRWIMPPPPLGAGIRNIKKTSHRTAYNSPAAAESLQRPPRFHRYICNCT